MTSNIVYNGLRNTIAKVLYMCTVLPIPTGFKHSVGSNYLLILNLVSLQLQKKVNDIKHGVCSAL